MYIKIKLLFVFDLAIKICGNIMFIFKNTQINTMEEAKFKEDFRVVFRFNFISAPKRTCKRSIYKLMADKQYRYSDKYLGSVVYKIGTVYR